jgi:hypothetical protein
MGVELIGSRQCKDSVAAPEFIVQCDESIITVDCGLSRVQRKLVSPNDGKPQIINNRNIQETVNWGS